MPTRDRWIVADNTLAFDSDTMVFVSPPPVEKSKAVAPIMPFNIYVGREIANQNDIIVFLRCGVL